MFRKGTKKGTIRFSLKPAVAVRKVEVAGDFNDWALLEMKKQKGGSFAVTVNAPPGAYEYKFIIDGDWQVDPDHSSWALNPFGTLNSVAQVG